MNRRHDWTTRGMGWAAREMESLIFVCAHVGPDVLGNKLYNRIQDLKRMLDEHNGHPFRRVRI